METRRWAPYVLATVLMGALWGWESGALAQTPEQLEEAKEAWKTGSELFDKGDYPGAMKAFERGHRLSGKDGFLFNMAECARLMEDKAKAKALYQRYLKEYPQGKQLATAKQRCQELGLGQCSAAAGAATETAPSEHKPEAQPRPLTTSGVGQPAEPQPYLPQSAEPATSSDSGGRPFYKHWGFWVGVGAVVAAGTVTAIVLGTRGSNEPDSEFQTGFALR